MSRTVVITGLGATTPLGGDVASTWESLLAGRSGVHAITEDWAADLPTKFAARVVVEPDTGIPRGEARRMDRSSQLGVAAALEAWADAGFALGEENDLDRERLAVSIGTGIGGLQTILEIWDTL